MNTLFDTLFDTPESADTGSQMHGTYSKSELEQMLSLLDLDTLVSIDSKYRQNEPYTYGRQPLLTYSQEALVEYATAIYHSILPRFDSTSTLTEEEYISQWIAPYNHLNADLATATEVGVLCLNYNNELTAFVGIHSTLTDQALAALHGIRVHKPKYGSELTRLRQPILDRLAFYSLRKTTIDYITTHRAHIPEADWLSIAQALTHRVITQEIKDIITTSRKAIKDALATPAPTHTQAEVLANIGTVEDFISNFLPSFEVAYFAPQPIHENATLDDIFADLDAFYQSQTETISFEAVQAQQKSLEAWYYDYHNISQSLSAVLQIALNNINPSTAIAPEVLSHEAVKGMLIFAEQIKRLYNTGIRTINYDKLAEELRHQLREHTGYFTDATPLPELTPTSKEQLIESGAEVLAPTTPLKPSLFDLTPPIQELLDKIGATTAIAEVEFLSVSDPQLLVPVPDYTIKQLSILLTGQPCTPYLLANGDLVIYIPATNSYVKPVPQIRDDDYVDYIFRAYNWDLLQNHIITLQKTIKNIPTYVTRNNIFIWQPLPKTIAERKLTFTQAKDYLETLLSIADEYILEEDYTSHYAYEQACYTVSRIETTHYFKDLYISGHRLSAWVFYPEEYNDKIACKPVDVDGNRLYYEPNHIDLNRSNNRKENLKIELKQTNAELRSSSKPVFYQGLLYLTIKKYCDSTGAGNYKNLQNKIKNLDKLKPGTAITYLTRQYTRDTDSNQIIATDLHN